MPAETPQESDGRILSLFDSPSEIETPTPGVKAWLAGDIALDGAPRPIIIKRVREASGMGQRKARATEALHLVHTNILPPRRWVADGGYLYVVREVVRGKNLRQSLTTATGEKPGPELLRKLLLPIMDALAYAHQQGVIHGGVSPENILIGEDGRRLLIDFGTVDSNAPRHQANYSGSATVGGDVRAFGSVLAAYLPTAGAFQNLAVRGRIEGVIRRCDSIDDLREVLNSLEKLAATPLPTPPGGMTRPKDGVPSAYPPAELPVIGIARLEIPEQRPQTAYDLAIDAVSVTTESPTSSAPISVVVVERGVHVPQGGGGMVTLHVRNEGAKPLILRTVATQYAWLNVRPVNLPLPIPVSGAERLEFAISAARLTPGEYRSEVYLTVNAVGEFDERTNTGLDKHISEIRVTVEPNTPPLTISSQATAPGPTIQGKPPFPANVPKVSGGPGCAALPLLLLAVPLCLVVAQLFSLCSPR